MEILAHKQAYFLIVGVFTWSLYKHYMIPFLATIFIIYILGRDSQIHPRYLTLVVTAYEPQNMSGLFKMYMPFDYFIQSTKLLSK